MSYRVTVRYFAALREQRGIGVESLETMSDTPARLFEEMAEVHGLKLDPSLVRAAIGDEFVSMDRPLMDGDEIVFLPPMAGG